MSKNAEKIESAKREDSIYALTVEYAKDEKSPPYDHGYYVVRQEYLKGGGERASIVATEKTETLAIGRAKGLAEHSGVKLLPPQTRRQVPSWYTKSKKAKDKKRHAAETE